MKQGVLPMSHTVKILTLALTALFLLPLGAGSVPLADPYILLDNGTYYAYGTHSNTGIEVYTSNDLKTWKYSGLALKKGDAWGSKWFWAPEVYKTGNGYLMYYSAEEHICAAEAKSPLGPFTRREKTPMLPEWKAIDHTLVIINGRPRIYFSRIRKGLSIWTAELEDDLVTIKRKTLKRCIAPSQKWEKKQGAVNEGAAVLQHNGKFHLTYSANDYQSQDYGIGCAVSNRATGPWKKYADNPLLQKPGKLVGVGHHCFFYDKNKVLRVVFHAHLNQENIHPRQMHITTAGFKNGKLEISPDYFTPQLQKE